MSSCHIPLTQMVLVSKAQDSQKKSALLFFFQGRKKNIVLSEQPLTYLHFSVALLRVLLWRMMNHFLLLESVFFKIDMKEPERKKLIYIPIITPNANKKK